MKFGDSQAAQAVSPPVQATVKVPRPLIHYSLIVSSTSLPLLPQSADGDQPGGQMTAAVGEIKKLNEQMSQLRQENIVLKVSEVFRKQCCQVGPLYQTLV